MKETEKVLVNGPDATNVRYRRTDSYYLWVGQKVTSNYGNDHTHVVRTITMVEPDSKCGSGARASANGGDYCSACGRNVDPVEGVGAAWFKPVNQEEAKVEAKAAHPVTPEKPKTGWRKLRKEDLELGLGLRLSGMRDTPFNGCVVLSLDEKEVRLARPMAYASDYNENQPLLYSEVWTTSISGLCDQKTDAEVWQSFNGKLLNYYRK